MSILNQLEITWDGPADTEFFEDLEARGDVGGGLAANLLVVRKKTSLTSQVAALGTAGQLVSIMNQHPLFAGLMATILLAVVSPVSLDILSEDEAQFVAVIDRLRTGYEVNEARVRALLAIDPLADQMIQTLVEKGLVRRSSSGKLIIQRRVLANVKIGP